ncbi:MAG: hypothetical protein ABI977_04665, partial [Acidobacteriota bacterium]
MSKFDDELRLALRREEPSPDFTDRLMARIQLLEQSPAVKHQGRQCLQEKPREEHNWRQRLADLFRPPAIRGAKWAMAGAMAVVLIAAIFGVNSYREHQRQMAEIAAEAANAEGQRAKEQV